MLLEWHIETGSCMADKKLTLFVLAILFTGFIKPSAIHSFYVWILKTVPIPGQTA